MVMGQKEYDRLATMAVERIFKTRTKALVERWAKREGIIIYPIVANGLAGVQLSYKLEKDCWVTLNIGIDVLVKHLGQEVYSYGTIVGQNIMAMTVRYSNGMPVTQHEENNQFIARNMGTNDNLSKKVAKFLSEAEKLSRSGKLFLRY